MSFIKISKNFIMPVDGKKFFCFWHKKHVLKSFSVFCDHPRIQCGVLPVSLNCNNHYTTYKNYKVGFLSKIGVLGPQSKLWRVYFSYDSNRLTGGHIDSPVDFYFFQNTISIIGDTPKMSHLTQFSQKFSKLHIFLHLRRQNQYYLIPLQSEK